MFLNIKLLLLGMVMYDDRFTTKENNTEIKKYNFSLKRNSCENSTI